MKNHRIKHLSILGSTGSIGTQTLDVVRRYPDRFKVEALTAGKNWELLAEQAREFKPRMAVIADEKLYEPLSQALADCDTEVLAGHKALVSAAILPESELVVGALVGYSGLPSVLAALEADKPVALANKESLVVAGELITKIIERKNNPEVRIIPVDSEHSAIFQCLWGENPEAVSDIILTASGGPFRNFSKEQLARVTVEQALSHPNWRMGAKVTIDSATMMNKGFEMIEAKWLFNMRPDNIKVVVHPESIVHSLVEFVDGSVKAQLSMPDMHIPIALALSYPERLRLDSKKLHLASVGSLTFEQPDILRFPLLGLAYAAAEAGGLEPAVMNAANEVAVKAFLGKKIGFTDISGVVMATVKTVRGAFKGEAVSLDSIAAAHREGTEIALDIVDRKSL